MTGDTAFVALGSNLGDRAAWLRHGHDALAALDNAEIVAMTTPEETAPLGGLEQPTYLNAMLRIRWRGGAAALLAACHQVERSAGRDRRAHWQSRTLDLDLVRFGTELCDRPDLRLPHPGLRDREFWSRQLATLEHHD